MSAPAPISNFEFADVFASVKSGEMVVLDVRDDNEVAASGKAAGSTHIPLGQLAARAGSLPKDKPVAIYCAVGGRAGMALNLLSEMGHDQLLNIGGFQHWLDAGGEVER